MPKRPDQAERVSYQAYNGLSHRITGGSGARLSPLRVRTLPDSRYPSLSSFPTCIITRPLIILG